MFGKLWDDILERCERFQFPLVQDKEELRHIFNLMQGCKSYLEVGSAEGNSLYVLKEALTKPRFIEIIDLGEGHTAKPRQEISGVISHLGNSHDNKIIDKAYFNVFDCVLIDAGHDYEDVIADAVAYGRLAKKYIFFHDIQLPPVKAAFEWYCKQNPHFKISTFINSPNYGYGILEI